MFIKVLNKLRHSYSASHDENKDTTASRTVKKTGIRELDEIVAYHFQSTKIATISITGRYLPLIYKIVSQIASEPEPMSVLVVDLDSRFQATQLPCSEEDLRHIYVLRPARTSPQELREMISGADQFLLYNTVAQASANREWWGTIVLGGLGAGDVTAGWKGWLRVDREEVRPFPPGISLEEALKERDARQAAVDLAGWLVSSPWGSFTFHDT